MSYQRVEFLANVGVFLPVGMFLLLLFRRRLWFLGVLIALVFTTTGAERTRLARGPDARVVPRSLGLSMAGW
ncbi:MAG: hypothetical protein ACYCZY_11115 [Lacisediminihabitans sp.]